MSCSSFLLRTEKINKAVAEVAFVREKILAWIFVNESTLARKLGDTFLPYFSR